MYMDKFYTLLSAPLAALALYSCKAEQSSEAPAANPCVQLYAALERVEGRQIGDTTWIGIGGSLVVNLRGDYRVMPAPHKATDLDRVSCQEALETVVKQAGTE